MFDVLKKSFVFLLLTCGISCCPLFCHAGGPARLVKAFAKSARSFRMSEKTSREVGRGAYIVHRYYENHRQDDYENDGGASQIDDTTDSGWWWIAIGVIAAIVFFVIVPFLICRWLYRKWKRWLERHKGDWMGWTVRLFAKKSVWIGIIVVLIAVLVYSYIQDNKKTFAASCIEEVLREDTWRGWTKSRKILFKNDEFLGVRIGTAGCGSDGDWVCIPMVAEKTLDDDALFVSEWCGKTVAFGRIISMGIRRELSPKVTRAIIDEDDMSSRVKRAFESILALIGEPYRSRGWYWNGHAFVVGAENSEDEFKRVCVYVSCNVETNGQARAYVYANMKSPYLERGAIFESALRPAKESREFLMMKEAEDLGMSFDEFSRQCEKFQFSGVFGIKLGDVLHGEEPRSLNDGAISSVVPPVAELQMAEKFNIGECVIFQLPLSQRIFRIGWVKKYAYEEDAFAMYDQMVDYFEGCCRRRLYDELRGNPRDHAMWSGVRLLRRDSIAFARNRELILQCVQINDGEVRVSIEAVDYGLQKQLPDEVGTILKNETLK